MIYENNYIINIASEVELMDFPDFFVLIATVFNWIKMIIAALGLDDNEYVSKLVDNINNASGYIDTAPNTST